MAYVSSKQTRDQIKLDVLALVDPKYRSVPLARISHEFWIEAVEWWGGGLFLQRERYSGFFETLNGHPGTRAAIFARTSRAGRDHGSGWRFWFDTRRAFSATQGRAGGGKDVLPGIGATETDPDAARGDAHLRGDFQ